MAFRFGCDCRVSALRSELAATIAALKSLAFEGLKSVFGAGTIIELGLCVLRVQS